MVMGSSTLIVSIAALLLVVLVACGGESKPAPSPTARSAPGELTPEQEDCLVAAIGEQAGRELFNGERSLTSDEVDAFAGCGIGVSDFGPGSELPNFDMLPEASAPAELGTVAWPPDVQESSALFGRLPSEIAGHGIIARFDRIGPNRFDTTYGEDPQTNDHVLWATVQDLAAGDFFPPGTSAGQFVALFAQGLDWEVLAAGREGDLAWVQFETTATTGGVTRDIYAMFWGNDPSSVIFGAQANEPGELIALVEAMVSAAGG